MFRLPSRKRNEATPAWAPRYWKDGVEVTEAEYKAGMNMPAAAPAVVPPPVRLTPGDAPPEPYAYQRAMARRAAASNSRFSLDAESYYERTGWQGIDPEYVRLRDEQR